MDIDIIWDTTVRLLRSGLLPPVPPYVPPSPPPPVVRAPIETPDIPPLWAEPTPPDVVSPPFAPWPQPGSQPPIESNAVHPITGAPIWWPEDQRPPAGFPGLGQIVTPQSGEIETAPHVEDGPPTFQPASSPGAVADRDSHAPPTGTQIPVPPEREAEAQAVLRRGQQPPAEGPTTPPPEPPRPPGVPRPRRDRPAE